MQYPTIRVHTWGGFGSQLLALALLLDLRQSYPSRRYCLVFHSSGVTRRPIEIKAFLEGVDYVEIDDFLTEKLISSKTSILRKALKLLLHFTYIVQSDPGSKAIPKIYPWTQSIRGHYSFRPINSSTMRKLIIELMRLTVSTKSPTIFVHFRLGDLLTLQSKTFSSPEKIVELLNQVLKDVNKVERIVIATESPKEAKALLAGTEHLPIEFETFDPTYTLSHGLNSRIFIGTNSKLSLWIALMRCHVSNSNISYLPQELARNASIINCGADKPALLSYH